MLIDMNRAPTSRAFDDRVAAAPISWGVCEVPGWGYQLPVERVLGEMRDLGLTATEFGPDGFLPGRPDELRDLLAEHRLRAVGGFVPVLLHDPGHDPLPEVDSFLDTCLATGADVAVLAAYTGAAGYDGRPTLDDPGWQTLLDNLDRIDERARARGVTAALHPHVGTMVETSHDVHRVISGSRVGLCVDTGHLLAGGTDPVALTRDHVDRVVHVHLKDVRDDVAAKVRGRDITYGDAIDLGLYAPLGDGDVDVATLVRTLEDHGYAGWYVLEQDVKLSGEPNGEGPLSEVRASLEHLRAVAS
jgi:inosose dehydratase